MNLNTLSLTYSCIQLLIIYTSFLLKNRFYNDKFLKLFDKSSFIIVLVSMIIRYYFIHYEVCEYYYECSNIDDTLHSDVYLFQHEDKCLEEGHIFDIVDEYYEITKKMSPEEVDCSNSQYGCCYLDIHCNTYSHHNYSPREYWSNNTVEDIPYSIYNTSLNRLRHHSDHGGMINTQITKYGESDEEYCPDFIDMYEVFLKNKQQKMFYNFVGFIGSYTFVTGLIIVWGLCTKKEKGNDEEKTKIVETGSV